ncbi:MAG: hypothetical protein IJD77_01005 [Clostridia bacterium]|nr:hypothetical protein [Clostridia bacterium]
MKQFAKVLSPLLFLCLLFGIFSLPACKDKSSKSIDISYYLYETKQEIEKRSKEYSYLLVQEDLKADLEIITNAFNQIPNEPPKDKNKEVVKQIDTIKYDCFSVIQYYIELDKILLDFFTESDATITAYDDTIADAEYYYQQALLSYPNYYKGSEQEYLAERKVFSDKIEDLRIDFDLSKKYWVTSARVMGMTYEAYEIYVTNIYNTKIQEQQKYIDALDAQWAQRVYLEDLQDAINDLTLERDMVFEKFYAKYADSYEDYYYRISYIVSKYE